MSRITLSPMTHKLAYEFYDGFIADPTVYISAGKFTRSVIDEHLGSQARLGNILFAAMLDGKPIGEVKLYSVSTRRDKCELSIHLKNDEYKGKGYGSAAARLAMRYVYDELKINNIYARTRMKNERVQRFIKKLGFREDYREYGDIYYERTLGDDEVIKPIKLTPMTRELYRTYNKLACTDPPPLGRRREKNHGFYDAQSVNAIFTLQKMLGRDLFAIMLDGEPIGEVGLYKVDYDEGECYVNCTMRGKDFRNRGYGKKAIEKILVYAKKKNLSTAYAQISKANTHAMHVLEKLGFTKLNEESSFGHKACYLYSIKL